MPVLEEFDVTRNRFTKIDFKYFNFTKKIKLINFFANPITEIINYENCCLHNWTEIRYTINKNQSLSGYIYDKMIFDYLMLKH